MLVSGVLGTMLHRMCLAGFRRMVVGMCAMARSGVRMMGRGFDVLVFVMLCGLAMMMRGALMMFGCTQMMVFGRMLF